MNFGKWKEIYLIKQVVYYTAVTCSGGILVLIIQIQIHLNYNRTHISIKPSFFLLSEKKILLFLLLTL